MVEPLGTSICGREVRCPMTPWVRSVSDMRMGSTACEGMGECGCFSQFKDKLTTP